MMHKSITGAIFPPIEPLQVLHHSEGSRHTAAVAACNLFWQILSLSVRSIPCPNLVSSIALPAIPLPAQPRAASKQQFVLAQLKPKDRCRNLPVGAQGGYRLCEVPHDAPRNILQAVVCL